MRIRNSVEDFNFSVTFRGKGEKKDPEWVDEDKWGEPTERLWRFISDHGIYNSGSWYDHDEPKDEDWFKQSYSYTPSLDYYWDNHTEYDFVNHLKMLEDVQAENNGLWVYFRVETDGKCFDGNKVGIETVLGYLRDNYHFPVCSFQIDYSKYYLYKSPETKSVFVDVPAEKMVKEDKHTVFLAKKRTKSEIQTYRSDVTMTGGNSFKMKNLRKYERGNTSSFQKMIDWRKKNLSRQELEYIKEKEPDFGNA
jgi:hypothetical protein